MKCTLVSFAPYPIEEKRPSVVPYQYNLDASDGKIPSILVIENAKTPLPQILTSNTFSVPIPAEDLANDLIENHIKSQPEYAEDAYPAFFWLPGSLTAKEVLSQHPDTVKLNIQRQINWFTRLVKAADDMWARNKQRRLISDKYIFGCQKLGLKREWAELSLMNEPAFTIQMISCPWCTYSVPEQAIVCMNCKNPIDKVKYAQLAKVS